MVLGVAVRLGAGVNVAVALGNGLGGAVGLGVKLAIAVGAMLGIAGGVVLGIVVGLVLGMTVEARVGTGELGAPPGLDVARSGLRGVPPAGGDCRGGAPAGALAPGKPGMKKRKTK